MSARPAFIAMLVYVALVTLLFGCLGDQKGKQDQAVSPPVINIPPSQKVDTAELRQGIKEDITASSNATANQMTGAVNASVSKLAEKLTGLEANLSAVMTNTATLNAQASAELRAKLEASLAVVADLRAELKVINEFNARIESRISLDASLVKELKTQIGELNTKVDANVNGQAGLYNRIESKLETISNTAGRDINYMPKDVAMVMIENERSNAKVIISIVSILAGVISTAIGWFGKNAYNQANNERKILNSLILEMAGRLHPDEAAKFEHKFAALQKK